MMVNIVIEFHKVKVVYTVNMVNTVNIVNMVNMVKIDNIVNMVISCLFGYLLSLKHQTLRSTFIGMIITIVNN